MSELLYNKSKAVEELNKVEGFYPLNLPELFLMKGRRNNGIWM